MVAGPENDDALLVLVSVANEMQAALIVNTLEDHGIRATATGDFTSGFRAEAPGDVRVLVKRSDLSEAREVLQSVRELPDNADES